MWSPLWLASPPCVSAFMLQARLTAPRLTSFGPLNLLFPLPGMLGLSLCHSSPSMGWKRNFQTQSVSERREFIKSKEQR